MAATVGKQSLSKLAKFLALRSNNGINSIGIYNAARSVSAFNKDWKPGPYPKTPEERAAAAKKYGLIPEDYEPYPDDGSTPFGDYPKLEPVSGEARDPYRDWDFRVSKKNYGEPMHVKADLYTETRYNINARPKIPTHIQYMVFLGVIGGSFLLFYILEQYKIHKPMMPKQYPKPGEVHYTFEPAS